MLKSVESLRKANNKKILDMMAQFIAGGSEGLEVGCAVGLFMEQARESYRMRGIEPMEESFEISKGKGLDVSRGFFPNDMDFSKKYDFIIFNDVFEHIPDINHVMKSCSELLKENGFLIINLPDSDGILHRISKLLYRFGDDSSAKRLWQLGTASPHLYYFNSSSLDRLNERHGFRRIRFLKLDSFSKDGLWERVNAIPMSKFKAGVYNFGLNALYPVLKSMHSDTNCYVYQK